MMDLIKSFKKAKRVFSDKITDVYFLIQNYRDRKEEEKQRAEDERIRREETIRIEANIDYQKGMEEEESEETLKFSTMPIRAYPRINNIIGEARDFSKDLIHSIESGELYKSMGVSPDSVFLITGKPGTGKTMSVNAVLNEVSKDAYDEAQKKFSKGDKNASYTPGLIGMSYDIGRQGSIYINENSTNMQEFFDTCFTISLEHKVLVVMDEADVLFGKRGGAGSSKEDDKVLETIMKNLQMAHDENNVYVVLMSNFADAFDEASIRAGRIDKRYDFRLPNLEERANGFERVINQINDNAGYSVVESYDTYNLAKIANEFSYADITESVKSAVKRKVREIYDSGKMQRGHVNHSGLEDSVNNHKMSFVNKKGRIGFGG